MTNRANPRLKKAAALAALTLALSLPASGILAASTFEAHYTTASVTAQEQIAGNLLNLDRSNYNLAELTIDPALSRIARLKSEDMRDNRYFAHVSPTYGDVRDMLSKLGYAYTAAGENIALVLERRYPTWREDEKARRRAVAALQRLGYSFEQVRAVMGGLDTE